MNIRERLEHELKQIDADASAVYDRAPTVAARYIGRRLDQLDRRFPRHGWGWKPATVWRTGLHVIPPVWGHYDAYEVAMLYMRRLGQCDGYRDLRRVIGELDTLGQRIRQRYGRPVERTLSTRARAWGVDLDRLCPDPGLVRGAGGEHGGSGDLASAAGPKGIWPMHRRGGCGYF